LLRENNPTINDLLENVREFNNTFKKPLEDKEVINYVAWALQQPKGYQSNRHIISTLGLTEREQTHLKTLINPKLAKKRKNARYYSNSSFYQIIKARNEEKREKAIAKAKELREQGYKLKDIATALNKSERTILRYLKEA
jgi:DNA polymerase IIIc chi subunit